MKVDTCSAVTELRESTECGSHRPGFVERVISALLGRGMLISMVFVLAGLALLGLQGGTGYEGAAFWPRSAADIVAGVLSLRPYALITLGILLLIVTPIVRVVVSIVIFGLERDRLYVAISLFVLSVLILSFLIGAPRG